MKKIIALLMAVAMLSGALAGCTGTNGGTTGGDNTGGDTTTPETTYEDTYKSTFSTSITSLNPYTTETASDYWFSANFLDALLETDKYGMTAPCVAESWEHSDDYTVWTYHLRQGIYWVDCNGQKTEYEVDADDFVSGMRYVADPANAANGFGTIRGIIAGLYDYYYLLSDVDDGSNTSMTREQALATFDTSVGVKAVDKYTVEYTMDHPCPFFDAFGQTDLMCPVEQAFLDTVGAEYGTAKEKMLYNGAYYISTWDRDKQITMTKNPYYWDVDNVHVNALSFEYVADNISSLELFKRGDVTTVQLSSEEVASIKGSEWEQDVYLADKNATTYWYSFNFATRNPELATAVQNENFRKAIFTAIDAVTLSAIWEPNDPEFFTRYTLLPEGVMFGPDGVDYTDSEALKPYKGIDPFDANKAKEYMKAAVAELCEADGVTLKGVTPGQVDMLPIEQWDVDGKLPIDIVYSSGSSENEMKKAALVKQMLETYLGTEYVNVILGYASNSFSADVYDLGNWDLVDDSYSFRYADPSCNLDRCTSDYDITYSTYSIPEYDDMIAKADGIYDIKERYAAFAEAEAWLMEHAYIKPFMSGGGSYNMTHVVPFTTPGGIGRSYYKMKGALIQSTPVTSEQYQTLKTQNEQEKAALSK
ncbi:MAG: peptide ABC transporter substrate-binding protein [Clostridiaceae bacterium]|nr:peptide ABC transporter substrate-binding protein [Clostridiaceae bacterium]